MLNPLELKAKELGFELVIKLSDGKWIISENLTDFFAFELPIAIGDSEAEAEAWLNTNLSETAGEQ